MAEGQFKNKSDKTVAQARKGLIFADDIVHMLVAAALLVSALFMLIFTASNFREISVSSILNVINDVLFVLIIMELLWTVIRYLSPSSAMPTVIVQGAPRVF